MKIAMVDIMMTEHKAYIGNLIKIKFAFSSSFRADTPEGLLSFLCHGDFYRQNDISNHYMKETTKTSIDSSYSRDFVILMRTS